MKKINFKSDFDFIAEVKAIGADDNKVAIDFPQYDWEIILTTDDCCNNSRTYVVSHRKGVATNCYNDNGKIHIICNNHKLPVGQLKMEFRSFLPNAIYPDDTQKVVATYDLDIELTTENTGITSAEVQIVLPFLYDSIYRIAQQSGYDGTQEEYYQLTSQLPNAVETANKVQASADSLADSAEQIGGAIETLGATTDAIEQGANMIKDNADTLQASANKVSESATKVEQAVEPLVQASESLDATKQAFEMLSSEWTDGRQAIATALTNRRYPTEPSESFHAMADKITNMSYEEGWFAKIGYTDENDGGIKDAIDYSYELAKGWNPDEGTSQMFSNNAFLYFPPIVDISKYANLDYMFNKSNIIGLPYDFSNATSLKYAFAYTKIKNFRDLGFSKVINAEGILSDTSVTSIGDLYLPQCTILNSAFARNFSLTYVGRLHTPKCTNFNYCLNVCNALKRIESIDFQSATSASGAIGSTVLSYMVILNIGQSSLKSYDFSAVPNWGTGSDENRQSLIDSLITYSYDRASNGMSTATIKLSANTKALLTEEEIAQITAKGFTIS